MTYLLDTNVCIGYLNGRAVHIRDRMAVLDPSEIVLYSVVKAELFVGALKSTHPERALAV